VVKPARRRILVGHLQERYRVSMRRACMAMRFCRSSVYYRGKRVVLDETLRTRITEIASTRIRYGYRRIHVLLRREGWTVNVKRVHRLYRQEGLSLRAKAPKRRRSAQQRQPRALALRANQVWTMDFMHDRLAGDRGYNVRVLTVVDEFTRECLALEVAPSYRASDVIGVLTQLVKQRGAPQAIRCDNGAEFTATAFDQWAYWNQITIEFSRPGKPTDNAFIESFNGSVRKELLNASWFDTLDDARRALRAWRRDYNENRPHRSLANKTPQEFALAALEGQAS
jgi:putative transposase